MNNFMPKKDNLDKMNEFLEIQIIKIDPRIKRKFE